MMGKIDFCPECNSKMTAGWIGEKNSLHWYDDPRPIRTIFGLGDPLFNTNPWGNQWGKQEAKRCFNCGLIAFKSELQVKRSFLRKPFAPILLILVVMIIAAAIAGIFIINIFPVRPAVPASAKIMGNITPIEGFRYFSGYYAAAGNHPAMYAHGCGDSEMLTIVGPGMGQEIPMQQSNRAFQVYKELLIKRGYKPE